MPRFVLQELQSVADSSDKLKRNRGRRGLDMLKRMQNNPKVELQMHEANLPELRDVHKVDERLVVLAKVLGARVVTNDFNLNKIAQLQGVEVINLNELANALKSVALPGEVHAGRLVKPGDQIGQGVGYLEDGTMVVVEQGRLGHRPGSGHHGDQRAADAGRPHDLRPDRSRAGRLARAGKPFRRRRELFGVRRRPWLEERFGMSSDDWRCALAVGLRRRRWPCRPARPQHAAPAGQGRSKGRQGQRRGDWSNGCWPPRQRIPDHAGKPARPLHRHRRHRAARWAEDELLQFHRIPKQAYRPRPGRAAADPASRRITSPRPTSCTAGP